MTDHPSRDEQLELRVPAAKPRARRRASDTSRAAAARASTHTEELRALILGTIEAAASNPALRGLTADEIHERTACDQGDVHDVRRLMEIRRRISDLHTKFKTIEDSGIRRVNAAGNPMIVWTLASEVQHG